MNAYNPLTATKRMEASGLPRAQAEAIAFEIDDGTGDLVTTLELKEALDAAINKVVIKTGLATAAIVGLACSIMGVIFAIK